MDVQVYNDQNLCPIQSASIAPIVQAVLSHENVSCDEVHIHFVTEAQIIELHDQFFQDPTPTDCISLQVDPVGSKPCYLGEIFISPQAAIDYLPQSNQTLEQEITLYLVHGLLHLLGYDDIEEEDRKKMRLAEKRHMEYLNTKKLLIQM